MRIGQIYKEDTKMNVFFQFLADYWDEIVAFFDEVFAYISKNLAADDAE